MIPIFLNSKENLFNITDKRMTRFNITLDEGVELFNSFKEIFRVRKFSFPS